MTELLAVVVSILLVANANSQDINSNGICSGSRVSPSGTYILSWYGNFDTGIIQFNASVDNMGWIAVGISNNPMMPDTDVILGAINQDNTDEYFISDRYASVRALPRIDAESNIFDASVMLIENNRVLMSFMRHLDTGDETDDISLVGCHHLLWAWAGTVLDYGDDNTPAIIRQHGARGVFSDQICCDELCSGCTSTDDGLFTYCWTRRGEFVDFNATAQTNLWVGLGVSMDRRMPNTDIVVGAANPDDATQFFVQDRLATGRALPFLDESNDLTATNAINIDGYTTISFTRAVDTGDDDDIDLTMCRYILWAYGGIVDFDTPGLLSGHTRRGVFSEQLCLPDIATCPGTTPCPSGCPGTTPSPSGTFSRQGTTPSPSGTLSRQGPEISEAAVAAMIVAVVGTLLIAVVAVPTVLYYSHRQRQHKKNLYSLQYR